MEESEDKLLACVSGLLERYKAEVRARVEDGGDGRFDAELVEVMRAEEARRLEGGRLFASFSYGGASKGTNVTGAMHGGAIASVCDLAMTMTYMGLRAMKMGHEDGAKAVTASLTVGYTRPVYGATRVECVAETAGRRLCTTTCRMVDERGRTLATAKHVKAVVVSSAL